MKTAKQILEQTKHTLLTPHLRYTDDIIDFNDKYAKSVDDVVKIFDLAIQDAVS